MKLRKLIILGLAAWAGTLYYQKFVAVNNLAHSELVENRSSFKTPTMTEHAEEGFGAVGGLGTVGGVDASPFDENETPPPAAIDAESDGAAQKLFQAVINGNKNKVKSLIEDGVRPDARDDRRRTPLMYAAWNGHNDICSLLLSAGAHIAFKDRAGFSALDYAAGRGRIDTVQKLLSRAHISDDRHYAEFAAIMQAARAGDASQLPPGTGTLESINRVTPESQSPMHLAAWSGNVALATALAARGAKADLDDGSGRTPLHWAAWDNQPGMVDWLAAYGANLSKRDGAGDTPLILATKNRSVDSLRALLARGADKSITNKKGKTALLVAEDKEFEDIAALLR